MVCVCVCVCVRERERESESVWERERGVLFEEIANPNYFGNSFILIWTSLFVMLIYFSLGNTNKHSNYYATVTECFPTYPKVPLTIKTFKGQKSNKQLVAQED